MSINYTTAVKYAVFCQKVYENFDTVQFDGLTVKPILISEPQTDTHCALLPEGTATTIVFRGTESSHNWETDFDTTLERTQFDQQVIQSLIVQPQEKRLCRKNGRVGKLNFL